MMQTRSKKSVIIVILVGIVMNATMPIKAYIAYKTNVFVSFLGEMNKRAITDVDKTDGNNEKYPTLTSWMEKPLRIYDIDPIGRIAFAPL